MDAQAWDERYAAEPELWGSANATVRTVAGSLPPGRAVDLACGNGRHAAWLASLGWSVEAVDYSGTAIEQARSRSDAAHTRINWTTGDVLTWEPRGAVDLVLVAYLHLPNLGEFLARAAAWLAPGGTLVYLGHARENIEHGAGGPSSPAVLPTVQQLAAAVEGSRVIRLEHLDRATDNGTAVDVLVVASPWA